jgi:hypothetical protein
MTEDNDIPTWWHQCPPIRHFRPTADHEHVRQGGMPLTRGVLLRIPDHDDYVDYYLWTLTWPVSQVRPIYRSSDTLIMLHRRAVLRAGRLLMEGAGTQTVLSTLRPLLAINAAHVFEEFLMFFRIKITLVLPDDDIVDFLREFLMETPNLVLNPTTRTTIRTWVETYLIPYPRPDGNGWALWRERILPTWDGLRETIYKRARTRQDLLTEELLAATWEYDHMIRWVLTADERRQLESRWGPLKRETYTVGVPPPGYPEYPAEDDNLRRQTNARG